MGDGRCLRVRRWSSGLAEEFSAWEPQLCVHIHVSILHMSALCFSPTSFGLPPTEFREVGVQEGPGMLGSPAGFTCPGDNSRLSQSLLLCPQPLG